MDYLLRALAVMLYVLAIFAGASLARGKSGQRGSFALLERWPLLLLSGGFLSHSAGLYFIGQELGRCPLGNLAQVFGFLGWSVVLIYLVIGPAYRLSLFGAFTAPVAALLVLLSLLLPDRRVAVGAGTIDPWVEFHAATGILAYGAFCLGGICGLLILLQDRHLKSGRPAQLFFRLPPLASLTVVNYRLIVFGFALLSAGIAGGFISGVRAEDTSRLGGRWPFGWCTRRSWVCACCGTWRRAP